MHARRIGLDDMVLIGAMLLALLIGGSAWAASIDIASVPGTPGAVVEVPVWLNAGPNEVAATQNDIAFDASVVSLVACRINPAIGSSSPADKALNSAPRGASVRNIVISLGHSKAIPPGMLYSCAFRVSPDAPGGRIGLFNSELGAATSDGRAVGPAGSDGAIIIAGAPAAAGLTGGAPVEAVQPGLPAQPAPAAQPAGPKAPQPAGAERVAPLPAAGAAGEGGGTQPGSVGEGEAAAPTEPAGPTPAAVATVTRPKASVTVGTPTAAAAATPTVQPTPHTTTTPAATHAETTPAQTARATVKPAKPGKVTPTAKPRRATVKPAKVTPTAEPEQQ